MKALRYYGNRDIRLEELPKPSPAAGEVLLKVSAAGLCQTQINEFIEGPFIINTEPNPLTGRSIPITAGHEFGGTVDSVGKGVDSGLAGKMMAVMPLFGCGHCEACCQGQASRCGGMAYYGLTGADGGFAEYAVIRQENLFPVADPSLLTFIEPLLVGLHSSNSVSRLLHGSRILVVGAGTIGISVAAVLRDIHGVETTITDVLEGRLERARKAGFQVLTKGTPNQYDIVFECAGSEHALESAPAMIEAMGYLKKGGSLILLGVYFHPIKFAPINFLVNEYQLAGSFCYNNDNVAQLKGAISDLKLDFSQFIETIPLERIIDQGYYRAEVDKDSFTRLVVAC